jgi:poly(beta-D-mannuronate) lyase
MRRICLLTMFIPILGCAHLAPSRSPLAAAAPAARLVSPWDRVPVALTQAPYDCAASPLVAPDITITKALGKSNLSPAVKQAVYPESDAALRDLAAFTVAAADAFRDTGSQAAARCTVSLLAQAAADHAMAGYMASSDAVQEQNMTLCSIAIAYLKVRGSGSVSPEEHSLISAWFEDIAQQERARIETPPCAQNICVAHGHHGIGVVMAVAAVAIANNDRSLFAWSLGQYRAAIDQIDSRGMLHYDTTASTRSSSTSSALPA